MKYLSIYLTIFTLCGISFFANAQELKNYSCIMDRIRISGMESSRSFDQNGIIKTQNRYHPLAIAQYGVMAYYYFKNTNDSIYYNKCVNQIKYFKDTAKVNHIFDGEGIGLPYNFNFWDLKAPWYSGMTQGYAISYLLRYYELTSDEEVIPIIKKVAYVLLQNQKDGGTISVTREGCVWIEEYPNSRRSPQVLNGYINGLIGLKEYVNFFPKDTIAKQILDETYNGLINSLQYFDSPTWSYYNRAKKSLSNKYLRYQIYEMKHLYEIFNDEIFDNQMRIWSVLSENKYIKSKSTSYKFPKHDISIPVKQIMDNRYGIMTNDKSLVLIVENVLNQKNNLSKKQLKRIKKKKEQAAIISLKNDSIVLSDYVEIINPDINEDTEVEVYLIDDKKRSKPIDFKYFSYKGVLRISFNETEINNLVFKLIGESNLKNTSVKFHNTNLIKPPFFVHYKTKTIELKNNQTYSISIDKYNSDKLKIFYKSGKNEAEFKNSKWEARHVVTDKFTPEINGIYQFMIVFDYQSPLSSIGKFEIH